MTDCEFLKRDDAPDLAYIYSAPDDDDKDVPIVIFCGGYRSDMTGTKATYFEAQCKARGQGYVRFDYSGHGQSGGEFEDGTIGSWLSDAQAIFDHVVKAQAVIVGSSMGGWIGLLLAKSRAGQVSGFVGLAAAPDFTEELYARFNDDQRQDFERDGQVSVPNDYSDEPYVYTKALYDDGKNHLLLTKETLVDFPVRLIHGMRDKDVPSEIPLKIQKNFVGGDLDIIFIDDGDHRLSREEDLVLIDKEIQALSKVL